MIFGYCSHGALPARRGGSPFPLYAPTERGGYSSCAYYERDRVVTESGSAVSRFFTTVLK